MRSPSKVLVPLLAISLTLAIASGASATPDRVKSAPAANAKAASTVAIAGKVAETFQSGGYSYVAVEQGGQRTWVATAPINVAVGQQIAFQPGIVMRNFTSSSLGRTFESIVFTQGLAAPAAPAAAPAAK